MKYCMLLTVVPLALLSCLPAAEPAVTPAEVQDLVFFGTTRPLRLRLHIWIDGKPFRAAWDDYLHQLFDYLDQDKDGVLNEEEAERAPKPQFLQQQLRGDLGGNEMMMKRRPVAELGVKLVGGKVKRQGLATYYRLAGLQAFIVQPQDIDAEVEVLTERLMDLLDRDKDGKLSKSELQGAEQLLREADANDDEVLTYEEIVPPGNDPDPAAVRKRMLARVRQTRAATLFFALGDEKDDGQLPYRFLFLYDQDKNEKLEPNEIGFSKTLFDQLDTNRDGRLDAVELALWIKQPPDLELTIRLGQRGEQELALEVRPTVGNKPALEPTLRDGILSLTHEDARLDLRVLTGFNGTLDTMRRAALEQFRTADADGNQYLDEKEAERVPFFRNVLASADQDGDGRLTMKEFEAYLDMQARAAGGTTSLSIRDHGRALFAMLDANGDGQLGVRELRSVWQRLAPLDRSGDGFLTRDELPRQFHLTLAQGPPAVRMMQPERDLPTRPTRSSTATGPLWFRKLDRNADGDLTRREFPGTDEEFRWLDADGDGLISAEEADRADARLRKGR